MMVNGKLSFGPFIHLAAPCCGPFVVLWKGDRDGMKKREKSMMN